MWEIWRRCKARYTDARTAARAYWAGFWQGKVGVQRDWRRARHMVYAIVLDWKHHSFMCDDLRDGKVLISVVLDELGHASSWSFRNRDAGVHTVPRAVVVPPLNGGG